MFKRCVAAVAAIAGMALCATAPANAVTFFDFADDISGGGNASGSHSATWDATSGDPGSVTMHAFYGVGGPFIGPIEADLFHDQSGSAKGIGVDNNVCVFIFCDDGQLDNSGLYDWVVLEFAGAWVPIELQLDRFSRVLKKSLLTRVQLIIVTATAAEHDGESGAILEFVRA